MKHNILLVEPEFPIPTKSKNHKNFLPIGLLKLASYYRAKNYEVDLVRGKKVSDKFETPSRIEITSLFTYWSEYVWDAVKFYREQFPDPELTEIKVGGIYASLHFEKPAFLENCKKYQVIPVKGVQEEAEDFFPAYDLVKNDDNSIDYQIVHLSRGCFRKCIFCGTWKIEPEFKGRKKIKPLIEPGIEIGLKNIVFYDNNLFYNPHIEDILNELADLKKEKKIGWCESQSGFDGRILLRKPHLAKLLKKAGFRYPRIAWDWGYKHWPAMKKQIQILEEAGYNKKNITVFMIYNWEIDFEEMERKRIKCWEWKVQISDCRNRPLSQLYDHYEPLRDQNQGDDYYIHPNWTDAEVKQFRQNVRRQNICNRQNLAFHSKLLEHKKEYTKERCTKLKSMTPEKAKKYLPDLWIPNQITPPKDRNRWSSKPVELPKNTSIELLDLEKETISTSVDYADQTISQRETNALPLMNIN